MRKLRRILVVVVSCYYSLGDESEKSSSALSYEAVEHISITMTAMMMMMSAAVKLDVCMDGY